jgi:hypothetical protein
MAPPIVKDPDSVLDYVFDYENWLNGDTISTSTWTLDAGITQDSETETTTTTTLWLSGGTAFTWYAITNRIVTAGGRTEDFSYRVFVQPSWSELGMAAPQNLYDVRREFINSSGRFDLVIDAAGGNYTDNGANKILNDAQRYLDRLLPHGSTEYWLHVPIAAGQGIVELQHARYIKEAWITDATDGRKLLTKLGTRDWLDEYPEVTFAEIDSEAPTTWTPMATALSPENFSEDIEGITLSAGASVVITVTAHKFDVGDYVYIQGVLGTTELNTNIYQVIATATDTVTLGGTKSSDFTAYLSAGTITRVARGAVAYTPTGITEADPAVVTVSAGHSFADGDTVEFADVGGMVELNGNSYTVANRTATTFELEDTDSSAFTTFTSGGTINVQSSHVYTDTDRLVFGENQISRAIIIMPPSDVGRTLSLLCAWKSIPLENNNDRSFWTVNEPNLLVRAGLMQLETDFHRNMTGRRDYQVPLFEEVQQLYHDMIAEEQAGQPSDWVMKG